MRSCDHRYLMLFVGLCIMIAFFSNPVLSLEITSTTEKIVQFPNQEINFTITIEDYPIPFSGKIYVETDLLDPHFSVKGSGDVKVDGQAVTITNTTDYTFQIEISGKTPIGKEIEYIKVFNSGFYATKFDEGPYRYYEVKLIDKEGNVLDRKFATFTLKFRELQEFDDLIGQINDEEAKQFAKTLMKYGQYEESKKFLELYIEKTKTFRNTQLFTLPNIIGIIVGFIIGFLTSTYVISKRKKLSKDGGDYPK